METTTKELVADRCTIILRQHSAKDLIKMFKVSERTARGWREGNFPQNKHLLDMVERWGQEFIDDIFSPLTQLEIDDAHHLECISHHVSALQKARVILSMFIVLFSTSGMTVDFDPLIRTPTSTMTRTRNPKD